MSIQEPASSRPTLIERGFCAGPLKVTEHVVVRLNIYWGVSLHCHYHLDQFIKQQDTTMMRQLRLLNKTGWNRLLDPHTVTPGVDVCYEHKHEHTNVLLTFEATELGPKVNVEQ